MYLSQKIGANLVRFVTSVHVANIFKVSNICKSSQKNLHAFAGRRLEGAALLKYEAFLRNHIK